ncbi:polymorphic toxin type 15 domain-containing protein [Actinomyces ruminis]|uniref:Novel toxin 15 domain-containing protein n=1 Tax=Actinomyces ruminis TaxID=1937003 RepID=A0ABX4MCX9_9ACTO|nr:polymorphic toxin type 15 domain-containing protein [Actinomyces ruminis]PHP53191.1 hypothetical protein BW737_004200 [Actinomyces ruminis]
MPPHPNNPSPANNAVPGLVAADMFTPGRAGGRDVLVWEGSAAAPASPLPWHSSTPVEVFFHTGHRPGTRALLQEFTRQLDRQLSALSLLSAQRLLEGIRTYREQGREPTSESVRKARKDFMKDVMRELRDKYQFSKKDARAKTAEINDALVVLHESDQVTFGPSQPGLSADGYPSMGHGPVNSSIGSQGKPMATALEQAALAVPAEQRAGVRILIRAVLTDSPELAKQLRTGQAALEPRSQTQKTSTSPRAPPWTPTKVATDIANNTTPWQPRPTDTQTQTTTPPQRQLTHDAPTLQPSPPTSRPGRDPENSAALRKPRAARKRTPEDIKTAINTHAQQIRQNARTPQTTRTHTNPKHPRLSR